MAAGALGLAAGAAALLRCTVVRVTVRGSSMAPGYEDGARVLVHRGGRVVAGRVVVLECPAREVAGPRPSVDRGADRRWIIKRVAAAPGDPAPVDRVPGLDRTAGSVVPPGRLVLLGDNPLNSYDSRQAGYFPMERVLGTVVGHRRRGPADPPRGAY